MTKKHFEWAAQYIADSNRSSKSRLALVVFAVKLFKEFVPNFDSQRFIARVNELLKEPVQ